MSKFSTWKNSVIGVGLDIDHAYQNQCVDVVLSWGQVLFPGIPWNVVFPPVPDAKDLFANCNKKYFTPIVNNHDDPNQVPEQGDIMVFGPTPEPGYSNQFLNPAGHTGVCDSATSEGYMLVQQDGSNPKGKTFEAFAVWKFRPCTGWLTPRVNIDPVFYTVRAGDTVYAICIRFDIPIDNDYAAFRKLNPSVTDVNKINVGQQVRIR